MAKGTVEIDGDKFAQLWKDQKSREKFAAELRVSASSVTSWSRSGSHRVNILKFESWPKSVQETLRANGDSSAPSALNPGHVRWFIAQSPAEHNAIRRQLTEAEFALFVTKVVDLWNDVHPDIGYTQKKKPAPSVAPAKRQPPPEKKTA